MSKYSNRDLATLRAKGLDDPKLISLFGELLASNFSRKMAMFVIQKAINARAELVQVLPELNIHLPAWYDIYVRDSVTQALWSFIPTRDVIAGLANWYRKSFTLGQIRAEMIGCWMDGLSLLDANRFSFDAKPSATLPRFRDYIRGRMIIQLKSDHQDISTPLSQRDTAIVGKYQINEAEALLTGRANELPNYDQLMRYRNAPFDIRDKIWAFGWSTMAQEQILPREQFRHADTRELILLARGYSPRDLYPFLTAKEAHDYLADAMNPRLMGPRSSPHQWFARRYGVAVCRSIMVMRWLHLLKSRDVVSQLNQPSPGLGLTVPMSQRLDEIQDSHIVKLSDTPKTVFARVDADILAAAEAEGSAIDCIPLLEELPAWCSRLPEGFRPLNSTLDLRMEGKVMRHCVGSYVESTRRGQSLCLSAITAFGRSTIEVTLDGKFCMQNKSYSNTKAPEEHLVMLRDATGLPFRGSGYNRINSFIQHWMDQLRLEARMDGRGDLLMPADDAARRTYTQTPLERVAYNNHSRGRHTPRGAGPLLSRINTHIQKVAPTPAPTPTTDVHVATLGSASDTNLRSLVEPDDPRRINFVGPRSGIIPMDYISRESMGRLLESGGGGGGLPTPSEQVDCIIDMVLHQGTVRGSGLTVQQVQSRPESHTHQPGEVQMSWVEHYRGDQNQNAEESLMARWTRLLGRSPAARNAMEIALNELVASESMRSLMDALPRVMTGVESIHLQPRQQYRSSHSQRQMEATARANEIYGIIPEVDFANEVCGRGLTANCTPDEVHMEIDVDFNH